MKRIFQLFLILAFTHSIYAQEFGQFTDSRDGKNYKTVKIGEQTWMAENLALKKDKGCWAYDNDNKNVEKYGYLYNWEAVQKICPSGWHLPTEEDIKSFLKALAPNKSKAYHTLLPNGKTGFNAQLGGYRKDSGIFKDLQHNAFFMMSLGFNTDMHCALALFRADQQSEVIIRCSPKSTAFSVRCIKD